MSNNLNGKGEVDWDAPVSTLSPGTRLSNDLCETSGRRNNRHKLFKIEIGGEDLYNLLELLMRVAVENTSYQTVARAVTCERLLYQQARDQGF